MANVVPLRSAREATRGNWSNDELAELYRVEHVLAQSGIQLRGDAGVSDEGDPWFVFLRDDGNWVVHIARYDGLYRLHSPALRAPLSGRTFAEVTKAFAASLTLASSDEVRKTVRHPFALLSLLIATICFVVDEFGEVSLDSAGQRDVTSADREVGGVVRLLNGRASSSTLTASDSSLGGVIATVHLAVVAALTVMPASETAAAVMPVGEVWGEASTLETRNPVSNGSPMLDIVVVSPEVALPLSLEPAPDFEPSYPIEATDTGGGGHVVGSHGASPPHDFSSDANASPTVSYDTQGTDFARRAAVVGFDLSPGEPIVAEMPLVRLGAVQHALTLGPGYEAIEVTGQGELAIAVGANCALHLRIAQGAVVELSIVSSATADGPHHLDVELVLAGQAHTRLELNTLTHIELRVVSSGSEQNALSLVEAAAGAISRLTVTGDQDLTINQAAGTARPVELDAVGLNGRLMYALDLGAQSGQAVSFDTSNFHARPGSSLVLVNVAEDSTVHLGVDLQRFLLSTVALDGNAAGGASIELTGGVNIGLIGIGTASTLSIGAEDHRGSQIGVLEASQLTRIELRGTGGLDIGRLVGLDADGQELLIDAAGLAGPLRLDLSQIGGQRHVTVLGGAGDDVLTLDGGNGSVELSGGGGRNTFMLSAGATTYTLSDLKSTDCVVLGEGRSVSTLVSLLATSEPHQQAIDATTTLAQAANVAGGLAGHNEVASAVLFSYQGGRYVFLDAAGDGSLTSGQDAIVKLAGLSTSDVNGVFHIG